MSDLDQIAIENLRGRLDAANAEVARLTRVKAELVERYLSLLAHLDGNEDYWETHDEHMANLRRLTTQQGTNDE